MARIISTSRLKDAELALGSHAAAAAAFIDGTKVLLLCANAEIEQLVQRDGVLVLGEGGIHLVSRPPLENFPVFSSGEYPDPQKAEEARDSIICTIQLLFSYSEPTPASES